MKNTKTLNSLKKVIGITILTVLTFLLSETNILDKLNQALSPEKNNITTGDLKIKRKTIIDFTGSLEATKGQEEDLNNFLDKQLKVQRNIASLYKFETTEEKKKRIALSQNQVDEDDLQVKLIKKK